MRTVKTDTHLLLVDETAEIKEGELRVAYSLHGDVPFISEASDIAEKRKRKDKIIAASPKLGDLPEFETLPPKAEDNESIMEGVIKSMSDFPYQKNPFLDEKILQFGLRCYKQAKSKTMFSLEDMIKAYREGAIDMLEADDYTTVDELFEQKQTKEYRGLQNWNEFIQSLTEPKEYEFVPEMEEIKCSKCGCINTKQQPKIVNNKVQGTWKQV